eukprot:GHVU01111318.1.p1 GENE.GHVU01111318.1~~GHVU01111318.1.p1  ORF type:complete len:273 (+),score=31.16 GHVU01111318.1:456-1274(+)
MDEDEDEDDEDELFVSDVFDGPIEGNFNKLEKLEIMGIGSSRCFASMSRSCAESLIELSLVFDYDLFVEPEQFPESFEGCFRKLRKFVFIGHSASMWFESISESCASSLEELQLVDLSDEPFTDTFRGNFTKLEKLSMDGVGTARCFASMSASCSHSLRELDLRKIGDVEDEEYEEFRKGLGGNLMKLEKLRLEGPGACQCFASVSESLAPSLVEVTIRQRLRRAKFVDAIPGEFVKLKFLELKGTKNAIRIFKQMKVDHDSVHHFSYGPVA